jgi:hypothetical protein
MQPMHNFTLLLSQLAHVTFPMCKHVHCGDMMWNYLPAMYIFHNGNAIRAGSVSNYLFVLCLVACIVAVHVVSICIVRKEGL